MKLFRITREGGALSTDGVSYFLNDTVVISQSLESRKPGEIDPGDAELFQSQGLGMIEEVVEPEQAPTPPPVEPKAATKAK